MINKTLLVLAGDVRWHVAASICVGLLLAAGYAGQGILLAEALAAAIEADGLAPALPFIIAIGFVIALRAVLIWTVEIAAQKTGQKTKETLRNRMFSKLLDLGPGYATSQRTGEIQAAMVDGVEALEGYFSRYLPAVAIALIAPLAIIVFIAMHDAFSAVLLAFFVILTPVANLLWLWWRMPKSKGIFAAISEMNGFLLDSLQGLIVLKAFNATQERHAQLCEKARTLRKESMRELNVSLMRDGITTLISFGGVAVILVIGAWRVSTGSLSPLELFLLLFLAREAFRPIEKLEREFHAAWAGLSAAGPIINFLNEKPLVESIESEVTLAPRATHLDFDQVSFHYPGTDTPAIKNISFTVGAGEVLALVGPSGAGKSTISSLLLRLFDPVSGSIRLNGTDIRSIPLPTLRSQMAAVSQDTHLFPGTIADNIRIAKPDATPEQIVTAARVANAHDFIMKQPRQYETEVGERGARLSGGQRQRIALARALLKDAPILILDEATSSVDPASERLIQDALERVAQGRITIVIAHRLSSIKNADRILVLDNGEIVEDGSHERLAAQAGLYSRLTLAQDIPA